MDNATIRNLLEVEKESLNLAAYSKPEEMKMSYRRIISVMGDFQDTAETRAVLSTLWMWYGAMDAGDLDPEVAREILRGCGNAIYMVCHTALKKGSVSS